MLVRIGDKIINRPKLHALIDKMLELRSSGFSQQEVANRLGIDRTAISKLESLAEIRKGGTVALIGFPIQNSTELSEVAKQEGIDFLLLLSERERWNFVESKSGVELFNTLMELVVSLRSYDVVIFMGSNKRIKLIETLLDTEVIGIEIGESPIAEDKYVSPEYLRAIIGQLRGKNSRATGPLAGGG